MEIVYGSKITRKENLRKTQTYNGIEWVEMPNSNNKSGGDSGSYYGSKDNKYMHRYVYENEMNAIIPDGYVIHHIDWNRDNNNISNLEIITLSEHSKLHNIGGHGPITQSNLTQEMLDDWKILKPKEFKIKYKPNKHALIELHKYNRGAIINKITEEKINDIKSGMTWIKFKQKYGNIYRQWKYIHNNLIDLVVKK
jgi:hypothetical protein